MSLLIKWFVFALVMGFSAAYFKFETRRVKQYMHIAFPPVYMLMASLLLFTDILYIIVSMGFLGFHVMLFVGAKKDILKATLEDYRSKKAVSYAEGEEGTDSGGTFRFRWDDQ